MGKWIATLWLRQRPTDRPFSKAVQILKYRASLLNRLYPPKKRPKSGARPTPKEKKQPNVKKGKRDVAAESEQDTVERKVSFQNDLDRSVDIYWVSPEGQENLMMSLDPGVASAINTYVGHRFIAKSKR